jgi:hypothetical protein
MHGEFVIHCTGMEKATRTFGWSVSIMCSRMKADKYLLLALLIFLPGAANAVSDDLPLFTDDPDTWQRIIPDVPYSMYLCSMALNAAGDILLAYKPAGGVLGQWFAEYSGSSWEVTPIDTPYVDRGRIMLSPEGYPRIMYSSSYRDDYRFAWFDGTAWSTEQVRNSCGNGFDCICDDQDIIHVLFTDDDNDVFYGQRDQGTWNIEKVGHATTWPVAICMDPEGIPHGVWQEDAYIKHFWPDTAGWQNENIIYQYAFDLALVSDQQGDLHLALQGASDLVYARRTQSGWSSQVVDPMSGQHCDIAVASDGTVHIAYGESMNSDLRYARCENSAWSVEVVSWEGYNGLWPTILLDQWENPWISHSSLSNCEIVWWGSDSTSIQQEQSRYRNAGSLRLMPNPCGEYFSLVVSPPAPGSYTIQVFDLAGRLVTTLFQGYIGEVEEYAVSSGELPSGTFSLLLEGEGHRLAETFIVVRQ